MRKLERSKAVVEEKEKKNEKLETRAPMPACEAHR